MPLEKKAPRTPKPPTPQHPPKVEPPVTTPAGLGSYGNASIDQWDSAFLAAAAAVRAKKGVSVDPTFLKAMMDVESGGNGKLAASWCRSDGSCGPMQIKPQYHQYRCPECDFSTVPGQIELAAHIIGDTMLARGKDEYDALVTTYFPSSDVLNGTTQSEYVNRVKALVTKMKWGTTPAPKPKPQGDVLDLLFGGKPYTISAHYGQLVTWSCPGCYDYFTAYGLDTKHHWAYDAVANAGDGAPLYAPFDGTIVCAGTGNGQGAWNTGCAAFARVNNYGGKSTGTGPGRLELLHADGTRSLILGHALSSRPHDGDRVKTGDLIGQQGGMNASHVHVEGRYANGTRIGDPRALFGGGPLPTVYPAAYDVSQPAELTTFATVKVIAEKVPVLQRAHRDAVNVAPDIPRGDTFQSAQIQLGDDGAYYWIGRNLKGRVPVVGTESELLGKR